MKILHVTEATSGGVLSALSALVEGQAEAGLQPSVVLVRRKDSPSSEQLHVLFAKAEVVLITGGEGMTLKAAICLSRLIWTTISDLRPSVVHLHSSFAGLIGRLCLRPKSSSMAILYSPHGFSFVQRKYGPVSRQIYRLMEVALHRRGSHLVLVSESERQIASARVSSKRLEVLENGLDVSLLPESIFDVKGRTIGTAARVVHQKGPWQFASLSERLSSVADFRWIGGGVSEEVDKWFAGKPVTLTGWLSKSQSIQELHALDIFVSFSLGEALPMSLIEAQVMGIPAVVSNVSGNIDVVLNGTTGYVCNSVDDFEAALLQLLGDPELRRTMGKEARNRSLHRFNQSSLGIVSREIYKRVLSRS